jgi:hypothetical protein
MLCTYRGAKIPARDKNKVKEWEVTGCKFLPVEHHVPCKLKQQIILK